MSSDIDMWMPAVSARFARACGELVSLAFGIAAFAWALPAAAATAKSGDLGDSTRAEQPQRPLAYIGCSATGSHTRVFTLRQQHRAPTAQDATADDSALVVQLPVPAAGSAANRIRGVYFGSHGVSEGTLSLSAGQLQVGSRITGVIRHPAPPFGFEATTRFSEVQVTSNPNDEKSCE